MPSYEWVHDHTGRDNYLPSPVALLEGVAMGAGYGLIPSWQAAPLVEAGQLVDVCPDEREMVDLFWHHWDLEPPMASDITALIVKVARNSLEPSVGFEPSTAKARESASPASGHKAEPQGGTSGQEASEQQ